jgi:hypothetical protein
VLLSHTTRDLLGTEEDVVDLLAAWVSELIFPALLPTEWVKSRV